MLPQVRYVIKKKKAMSQTQKNKNKNTTDKLKRFY